MKFTQSRVNSFQPPAGKADHDEIDEAMPGFGVRFRNGGTGTYFIKYKIGDKHGRLSLGKVGKVSLADAQAAARKHFAAIADKIDPSVERARAAAKASDTIEPLIDDFMRYLACEAQWRADHRPTWTRSSVPCADICRPTAPLQCHRHQPRYGRKGPGDDQNRARADRCRPQPRASIDVLHLGDCGRPYRGQPGQPAPTRPAASRATGVLQDSELAAIWNALGDDDYGAICRLLILTGARRDEIGSLRRGEINFAQKQIEFRAAARKAGRSHHPAGSARAVDLEGARTARGQRLRFRAREGRLRRLGQVQGAARCAARSCALGAARFPACVVNDDA